MTFHPDKSISESEITTFVDNLRGDDIIGLLRHEEAVHKMGTYAAEQSELMHPFVNPHANPFLTQETHATWTPEPFEEDPDS